MGRFDYVDWFLDVRIPIGHMRVVAGHGIGTAISDNWFVTWVFQAIGQIIVAPFSALVAVLLYVDLRARTEALTADQLRGELATNPT